MPKTSARTTSKAGRKPATTKTAAKTAGEAARSARAKPPAKTKTASKPAARTSAKSAVKPAREAAPKATAKRPAPAGSTAAVAVGKKVPPFSAEATGSRIVSSESLSGRPYVLYFYPKDDTPGCTTEGRDFASHYDEFRRLGVDVLGVSRDSLASHEKFKAKHGLPFDLISDPDEKLCRLFDVIREKSLYGRKFLGVERSTFLIDGAGVLVGEWRKVKVNGHVENVLQAARSL